MAKLLYQGHASLRLITDEGKTVYIDPYAGGGYDRPADLVLITHEHYDHNDIHKVPKTERTIIIRSKDALANGLYQTFSYFGISIEAVPAYNKNHDRRECVGYLLKYRGLVIYVAGDTSKIPEMEEIANSDIDYAFLPIDGIYNMGPDEASECARILHPKNLIPYHMHPGLDFDIVQDMKVHYEKAILVRAGQEIEI